MVPTEAALPKLHTMVAVEFRETFFTAKVHFGTGFVAFHY